ncbi:tail fiber domain-containing protein [Massilia sp. CT11-137]|uniref:tail fiber domain-containing protein n=1 Tax=Massilia sp. CT11-137 TaxID=3393901 RepID=UPI0039A6692F
MPALNINDLNNGKKDLDHIGEVATSEAETATDRLGRIKLTVRGAINSLKAFNVRGAFVGGTPYATKDVYVSDGVAYVALIDHVATTVDADLAAGKVTVHQGATREDLIASLGSSLIGFIQDAIGAVKRTVLEKLRERVSITDFMTDAQRADAKAYTYTLDMTDAFSAGMSYLVSRGGGRLFVPSGGYRLDGKAGADAYKDGILIPSTGGVTTTANGIIIEGEGAGTILRANSATMMAVRNARLFSGVRDLQIDGNGLASVIGYGGAPESITQTTTFTSQSYQTVRDAFISNCTHQIMLQPGPTVGGSDSGGFYHYFENVTTNISGTYDVWFRPDPTGAGNRTTRTTFKNCRFLRAVDSIYIQAGTEIDFISCWWELWTGKLLNYVPASAAAANIRLIGGYGESSGAAVGPVATAPEAVSLIGFSHNRPPDASEYKMHRSLPGAINVAKLPNLAARLTFGYPGFVDLVADPDNAGAKALELQMNGAAKKRFSSTGIETFYGTVGNIQFEASGATLTFTRAGSNVISATGAGATLSYQSDSHFWKTAAGTDILSLSASGLLARQDNATDLGGATFRFKTVYAGTGAINTSDGREKQQVQDIDQAAIRAVRRVKFVQFKFIDAVATKGDGARLHFGVIAQQVKDAFEAEGLDAFAYGLLCYDEWEETPEIVDEEGVIVQVARPAGNRYGVRYDELFSLKLAALEAGTN